MKEWFKKRVTFSDQNLLQELLVSSQVDNNFMRMEHSTFLEVLHMVTPLIQKETTVMREAVSTTERLSTTLRFLATGQSFEDLKFSTSIAPQTIGNIVMETCNAIIKVLKKNIKVSEMFYFIFLQPYKKIKMYKIEVTRKVKAKKTCVNQIVGRYYLYWVSLITS
jgi:hypothetical protein